MNSEQERPVGKVGYEKPTAVDLGPAAPVVGQSCAPGGSYASGGNCEVVGNVAAVGCSGTGNTPGDWCQFGAGYNATL